MNPEHLDKVLGHISKAIETTVNGKLDKLTVKLETHIIEHREDVAEVKEFMSETRPLLEAYKGGKVLGEGVKWLAGVGIAALAIKGIFMK